MRTIEYKELFVSHRVLGGFFVLSVGLLIAVTQDFFVLSIVAVEVAIVALLVVARQLDGDDSRRCSEQDALMSDIQLA